MNDLLRVGDGPEPKPLPGHPRDENPGDAPASILVVDDEVDARDAIVEILSGEGFPAVGAGNGREALELLEKGLVPALMLVDLRMPVMDGWAFCDAIASDERWAAIPVAIVTASASLEKLPRRANDAGLFYKPLNVARLLGAVRRFCG